MIKLEQTDVYGWEAAIRGMRNAMNSWAKSDSNFEYPWLGVGEADLELMKRLAKGGAVHAKYRRMINVTVDITGPLYWWKEFDTYKVGTVANSCSTMHKIHAKEFELADFSHEHLFDGIIQVENPDDPTEFYENSTTCLEYVISVINYHRKKYIETKDKRYWWQMIQLLPTSYNQKRTVQLNYEVLVGIYRDRKDHKLDEWHTLCDWIKSLPHSELITMEEQNENA